jgi:hypothetical protein
MRKGDIPGSYLLADETGGATLTTVLSGSPGMVVKEYHGSEAPFAGWQVIRGVPRPSSAIVVEQPAKDSWSVAVWAFANEQMATPRMIRQPQRTRWVSSGDWKISLPTWSAMFEIEWRHGRVSVMDDKKRGVKGSLQVHAPSDVGGQIRAIQEAFGRIVKKYPKSADFQRRYKASLFLLLAVGFQGVFFFALRRVSPQSYVLFRVGSVAGWVGVYLWLTMVRWKSWP